MKKFYEAPRLINHGSVQAITTANFTNSDQDFIHGTALGSVPGGGGSLDACITRDGKVCK